MTALSRRLAQSLPAWLAILGALWAAWKLARRRRRKPPGTGGRQPSEARADGSASEHVPTKPSKGSVTSALPVPQGAQAVFAFLRLFFSDEQDGPFMVFWVKVFLVASVILELANSYVNLQVNQALLQAMEFRDPQAFFTWLPFMAVCVPKLIADGVARFSRWRVRKTLRLSIMRKLCWALLGSEEPDAHVLYRLHFVEATTTPEHQITEDCRAFGDHFNDTILPAIGHAVSLALSAHQLFMANRGFFLRSLALLPITSAVNLRLASHVIGDKIWKQETIGATLRAFLGRIRSNVESVALFGGSESELRRYTDAHRSLARTKEKIAKALGIVTGANEALSYVLMTVPGLELLRQVANGEATVTKAITAYYLMEGIKGSAFALLYLPTVLVQAGVPCSRMLQLLSEAETLRGHAAFRRRLADSGYAKVLALERRSVDASEPVLELRDVTLWTPWTPRNPGQVLLDGLSFSLSPGESLLVAGETGAGKTALLAAIHGLWDTGRGRMSRCDDTAVFCVPQQPYTFQGSLREQLLYPFLDREVGDGELRRALQLVNLFRDLKSYSFDDVCPWGDMLSLGQQQRIGIARALLVKSVRLVLLDDCTSALDMWNERRVYAAVAEQAQCYVSTGHRPALRRYHTHTLSLQPGAPSAWRLALTDFRSAGGAGGSRGGSGPAAAAAAVRAALRSPAAEAEAAAEAAAEQLGEEAAAGGGASRGREGLPVADPMALLRCLWKVAWPILSARELRVGLLTRFAAAAVAMALMQAVSATSYALVATFLSLMQNGDMDGVKAFVLDKIWLLPVRIALVAAVTVATTSLGAFLTESLRLGIARRYLRCGSAGLYLLHTAGGSESPSEQVAEVCGFDCDMFGQHGLLVGIGLFGMFVGIVINFYGALRSQPEIAKGLVLLIVAYTVLVERCFASPSMRIFMRFLERNTALRCSIAHAYTHAHSVAFLRGAAAELQRCAAMAKTALDSSFHYLYLNHLLACLDSVCDLALQLFILGVTAPGVLKGTMSFPESQGIAMQLKTATYMAREFVKTFSMTTPIFSMAKRLHAFIRAVEEAEAAGRSGGEGIEVKEPSGPVALELRGVTLRTPRSALGLASLLVLRGVSASLPKSTSLLIAGESGLGKSSLLRSIAGLWSNGEGAIVRPRGGATFFIPQRPYLCLGSLREQLLYPSAAEKGAPGDRELRQALKDVGLGSLLVSPGLDREDDAGPDAALHAVEDAMHWTGRLSQGEVQRVSFARVLLRKGLRLVLLDEGTAAMDTPHEAEMYRLLGLHVPSYASVAHRPQLRQFHSHVLHLERDSEAASARFMPMADYERELSAAAAAA